MTIGDKKPTLFLREMQEVANNLVADQVLRELFLNQLPKSLREVLTVIDTASLESLAKAADRGWSSAQAEAVASATAPHTLAPIGQPSNSDKKIEELLGAVKEMMEHFARHDANNATQSQTRRPRSRAGSRTRPRSPTPTRRRTA